jgi:hypothetical protein
MNPFIFPALLVLFAFSGLSAPFMNTMGGLVLPPLVGITACMLSSIGLAATTGTGTRGAIVTTVLLVACVACVIFLMISSERRSRERRAKRAAAGSEK